MIRRNWFHRHAFLVGLLEDTARDLGVEQHRALVAEALVAQRDEQIAELRKRCDAAVEERGLWRRFYAKSMPPMDAL